MKKNSEKGDRMKHEGLGKRKKEHNVFEKKLCNKKKKERTNEESRHKECEHQEGT